MFVFCWNPSFRLQIMFLRIYVNPSAWRCVLLLQDYNPSLSGRLSHTKYCFAALRLTAKIFHYEWSHLANCCTWRLTITLFSRFKPYTNSHLLYRNCITCKMLEILVTSPMNVFLIFKCGHEKFLLQKRRPNRIWKQFQLFYTMFVKHTHTIPSRANCKNNCLL